MRLFHNNFYGCIFAKLLTSRVEQLPNTGETGSVASALLGAVAGVAGVAALGSRKKEDEK